MGQVLATALAGCGPRAKAPVVAPAATTPSDAAVRACAAQAVEVDDALARMADRFLWEEIDRLLQLTLVARRGPGDAGACVTATTAALVTAGRRWAEEGARTGGAQAFDLANRAYRALATHFAGAEAPLHHALGRLEFARAVRVSGELGEQTLAADRYAAAHEHHAAALRRGGLTTEEVKISATEQLEAIRRALDYSAPDWDPGPWLCEPDRTGTCATRPRSPVVLALAPADAQMLAAYDLLLGEPAAAGLPEAPPAAVDRAELLLRHGRLVEAEPGLRAVLAAHAGTPLGARAGLLLLRSLQVRWQDPAAAPAAQAVARARLIAATTVLRRSGAWFLATPAGEQIRRALPRLRAAAMWQAATAARAAGEFAACAQGFEDMAEETDLDGHDEAGLRFEAAACHEAGGALRAAIAGYDGWLTRFAGDRRAPEVVLRLARTHERVLNVEDARDHYFRFLALAPDDPQAGQARRRSILLALVTGTVEEAQVEALARDRRAGDRVLAAAIRFRTEVRPGSPLERVAGYLQKFGRDGGEARLAIAHVRAAEALMRSSCPASAPDGLCVEVTRERTLGRVLPRDRQQIEQARAHLRAASGFLATATASRDDLDAPLAVAPGELASARRTLSLLLGDLKAEAALSTRPPASHDPGRSQAWLERRTAEVQRMEGVYESVNPASGREVALDVGAAESTASDRFAAVIEARKAQVYEADIALLEEVAAAVASKSAADPAGAELAARMQRLADMRRGEVFAAYHRCVELVALWGQDLEGRAESCRAGLGRLVQRHSGRIEYVPDVWGRVH